MKLHLTDIYLEELAKVGGTELKAKRLLVLLKPFFNVMKLSEKFDEQKNSKRNFDSFVVFSEVLVKHVYKNLFLPIIQYSDVGIDPSAEKEMEQIESFGRQSIEIEAEENDSTEEPALQVEKTANFHFRIQKKKPNLSSVRL